MERIIEQIILDFQTRRFPELVVREQQLLKMHDKASVVIGVRRSGKTCFLFQEMRSLIENENADKTQLLYFNFEDDRLDGFDSSHLRLIPEVFYRLFPKTDPNKKTFSFLMRFKSFRDGRNLFEDYSIQTMFRYI